MSKALTNLAEAVIQDPESIIGSYTNSPHIPMKVKLLPKESSKKDKFDQLRAIEKELNKKFDTENSIVVLGDKKIIPVASIPTNLISLDLEVIGCGGIPRGRIVEIFGPESSGKTTVCLHIIAQEQKNTDNLCAYIDAEHSLDLQYAAKLGVNTKELLLSQPDSGEQALETAQALIESKTVSIIVIDSVSALVPRAELEGDIGDSHMGLQARLMSQAMRKLRGIASQNGVTIIFINQIREKIGVMFGSPETTSGGRALKFFASLRLDVRKSEPIKNGDVIIGHKVKMKAVKNKVGAPLKETFIRLIHGVGFDAGIDLIEYAVSKGVIEKSGAWYNYGEERLGQGLTNAADCVINNPDLRKKIEEKIRAANEQKS